MAGGYDKWPRLLCQLKLRVMLKCRLPPVADIVFCDMPFGGKTHHLQASVAIKRERKLKVGNCIIICDIKREKKKSQFYHGSGRGFTWVIIAPFPFKWGSPHTVGGEAGARDVCAFMTSSILTKARGHWKPSDARLKKITCEIAIHLKGAFGVFKCCL